MNWFLAGWVLVLHAVFWGLGLTLLVLPRRWRRFWPGFVAPVGLALKSAVVWAGAHTNLPGTDAYAFASLLLPLGLGLGAAWRMGGRPTLRVLAAGRGWIVLLPVMAVSLWMQTRPFTKPPGLLTTQSLTSCDAADYAAGARVFKEFASRDRSGFLGQSDEVRVLEVDNFYDFWLRINHFTPSALLAMDSTLLRRQPYELTSLLGVVALLLHLPTLFWLARSLFRFRPWAAAFVTAIYAFSPIVFYAVYEAALAQLLAAPAVALILWTAFQADRDARRRWCYAGLLLASHWLLLGSYNFFLIFAYVPLAAYLGGRALRWPGQWRAVPRLAGFVGANLLVCTLLFPERTISLGERLLLFKRTPFGWYIPAFRPDGWYGAFGTVRLGPAAWPFLALGALGLAAAVVAAWRLARRGDGKTAGLAAACTLPILCGYGILSWEDAAKIRVNACYDAYKLFTVFYPALLLAFCLWLRVGRTDPALWRGGAAALAVGVLAVNVQSSSRFNEALRRRTHIVDRRLSELAVLETRPDIDGINVRLDAMWDRLWANQFLLHKKQYFLLPTYEGRNATRLRARWDLCDRYFCVELPPAQDGIDTNPGFTLLDRQGPEFLDLRATGNWYPSEHDYNDHWFWSNGQPAVLTVVNPHDGARAVRLRLKGNSRHERPVRLFAGNDLIWEGTASAQNKELADVTVRFKPGDNTLRFETPGVPDHVPGDFRALGFCVKGLTLRPAETLP